ncbi:MAG: hypothetical protein IJ828_02705 [Treponema sp.]|nr:hypothetical protein [Treponema sp.]
MYDNNKNLALCGVAGAVLYAVSDWFLYFGIEIDSADMIALCRVEEWRLMASMWVGVFGSFGLLLGFISLYRLVKSSFGKKWSCIMIFPILAAGGILYCHFVLGVYNPLTYQSAIKSNVSENQIIGMLEYASGYLMPLTLAIVICGYMAEIIVIVGILSGKFGLKKRFLLFMYMGFACVVLLLFFGSKVFGLAGLKGGRESLFEITFFLPAFFSWKEKSKNQDLIGDGK